MKKSIAAGALIAVASFLYLKAAAPLGALLFGFALCFVCLFQLDLFTGKIGYLGAKDLPYVKILAGNLIGAAIVCLLLCQNTAIIEPAETLCAAKATLPWYTALINGTFCGVLMYLAVASYARGFKSGCFLCVSVFILCGFEHSIADFAYMMFGFAFSINLLYIMIGNALGAVICRLLIENDAPFFKWNFSKKSEKAE